MTSTDPNAAGTGTNAHARTSRNALPRVRSLDTLIGVHPRTLRAHYAGGVPANPETLGAAPRGRLLALDVFASAHALGGPLVSFVARRLMPWQGKSFESGGTSGANRVFGRSVFRFRCELGASLVDGAPTLFLRYDGLGNPWPLSHVVDELRMVGDDAAIGPALYVGRGEPHLLFFWGLER